MIEVVFVENRNEYKKKRKEKKNEGFKGCIAEGLGNDEVVKQDRKRYFNLFETNN